MITLRHCCIPLLIIFLSLFFSEVMALASRGQTISEISINIDGEYAVVQIVFDFPVQYLRHTPPDYGKEARIRLRPIVTNLENGNDLNTLESQNPPANNAAGVVRVEYEGRELGEPTLTVIFDKAKEFSVSQGEDYRSIIVKVPVAKDAKSVDTGETVGTGKGPQTDPKSVPSEKKTLSSPFFEITPEQQESLLKEGAEAMAAQNYARAVQVYTKLQESPDQTIQETVQFQLALAQEYANHPALAKAEFRTYMKNYPQGPNFDQAHDHLKALMSAGLFSDGETKEAAGTWASEFFGNISEFYYRDANFVENDESDSGGEEELVNVSSLTTGLDATWRLRNDYYQIDTVAVGSHEGDLTGDGESRIRVSSLYVDLKNTIKTITGRVGRQSGNSGGVLGRFDGGKFSYLLTDKLRMNLVAGFPVDISYDDLDTDKVFYGINFDLGRFAEHWDFNSYFINQTAEGIDDRRAIGTEIRYLDTQGSFFSLFDYDILYNELSLFLFSGNWLLPNDKTRLNFNVDYRTNPILSTSNALIGQVSPSLESLQDSIGRDAVEKLAEDRTLQSSFVTLGVSHSLSEDLQIAGDISWSKLDGAPASGGVEEMDSTGDEFYYSLQVIDNSFFVEGDITNFSLQYADTQQRDTYGLLFSTRQNLSDKWRLTPKFRVDFRQNKLQGGEQWRFRPAIRTEYLFTKKLRLEFEGEYSIADRELPGLAEDKSGYIISIGLRWSF